MNIPRAKQGYFIVRTFRGEEIFGRNFRG